MPFGLPSIADIVVHSTVTTNSLTTKDFADMNNMGRK